MRKAEIILDRVSRLLVACTRPFGYLDEPEARRPSTAQTPDALLSVLVALHLLALPWDILRSSCPPHTRCECG